MFTATFDRSEDTKYYIQYLYPELFIIVNKKLGSVIMLKRYFSYFRKSQWNNLVIYILYVEFRCVSIYISLRQLINLSTVYLICIYSIYKSATEI